MLKNSAGNVELGTIEKILQFGMRAELETANSKEDQSHTRARY